MIIGLLINDVLMAFLRGHQGFTPNRIADNLSAVVKCHWLKTLMGKATRAHQF
jgi:hypothetical protein